MKKLVRITTVALSLDKLLTGQLAYMREHYEVIAVSNPDATLDKVAEREGVRSFALPMTRKITPWQDLKAVYRLYRFLKREKPDYVHSHTPKAGIVGMMAAWLAGVPHRLHTVAGLPLLESVGRKRRLLEWVEAATYRFATGVYPNSFELKRIIEDLRLCPEPKLKVLANGSSNGIDVDHFDKERLEASSLVDLRRDLGQADASHLFVFVGRLVGDKGINELVAAFDRLRQQFPSIGLLLVGPFEDELDPLQPQTKARIEKGEGISLTGFVSDVRPYLALSDSLVFPSYREGFPNVVMQAGSMGLPCIVTDINGCNEIVSEGQNGLIIPVKDAGQLYAAMERLLTDGTLYQNLRAKARESIVTRYRNTMVWEALLSEYKLLERV